MVEGQLHRDSGLRPDFVPISVTDHKLHKADVIRLGGVPVHTLLIAPELVQDAALIDRGGLHGEGGSFRNLCILPKGQGCFHRAVRGLSGEALEVVHLPVRRGYRKAEGIAGERSGKGSVGMAIASREIGSCHGDGPVRADNQGAVLSDSVLPGIGEICLAPERDLDAAVAVRGDVVPVRVLDGEGDVLGEIGCDGGPLDAVHASAPEGVLNLAGVSACAVDHKGCILRDAGTVCKADKCLEVSGGCLELGNRADLFLFFRGLLSGLFRRFCRRVLCRLFFRQGGVRFLGLDPIRCCFRCIHCGSCLIQIGSICGRIVLRPGLFRLLRSGSRRCALAGALLCGRSGASFFCRRLRGRLFGCGGRCFLHRCLRDGFRGRGLFCLHNLRLGGGRLLQDDAAVSGSLVLGQGRCRDDQRVHRKEDHGASHRHKGLEPAASEDPLCLDGPGLLSGLFAELISHVLLSHFHTPVKCIRCVKVQWLHCAAVLSFSAPCCRCSGLRCFSSGSDRCFVLFLSLVSMDLPETCERPYRPREPSDQLLLGDTADGGVSGVHRDIPVVSHHEVLAIRYLIGKGDVGIAQGLRPVREVAFLEEDVVDVDVSVLIDVHPVARSCDHALDEDLVVVVERDDRSLFEAAGL